MTRRATRGWPQRQARRPAAPGTGTAPGGRASRATGRCGRAGPASRHGRSGAPQPMRRARSSSRASCRWRSRAHARPVPSRTAG
eukprot:scaffold10117_cov111-Isochrysis_galbana.AAC.4